MKRHVKIIGDPMGHKCRVVDSETGENIPGCYGFKVVSKVDRLTDAVLFVHGVSLEGEFPAEVIETPVKA